MKQVMSWFTELGEKTGRTDIWIMLIVIIALMFIAPVFLMSIQAIPMVDKIYDESLDIIKWVLTGMFVDLGIYSSFKGLKLRLNGTSSSPKDGTAI